VDAASTLHIRPIMGGIETSADNPGSRVEARRPELYLLGWDDRLEGDLASIASSTPAAGVGRVSRVDRGLVSVMTEAGTVRLPLGRELRSRRREVAQSVAVGDWVATADGAIIEVLPRSSAFVRGDPERAERVQVVAANLDTVFVVHSLTRPLNPRRLERELLLVRDGGAVPVLVLTKHDLNAEVAEHLDAAADVAPGTAVVLVGSSTGEGLEEMRSRAGARRSVALIGASGVGKSTIVNGLLGTETLATAEVRAFDQKGRHTTTARQLVVLPGGGILIDTPGLRALAIPDAIDGVGDAAADPLGESFEDVEAIAAGCRFSDCRHAGEPGCAVEQAVAAGRMRADRVAAYRALDAELGGAVGGGSAVKTRGDARRGGR